MKTPSRQRQPKNPKQPQRSPKAGKDTREVLRFSLTPVSRSTVRSAFLQHRKATGVPARCDNPQCRFHSAPLAWNGKPLPLILDHVEGVRQDNRPSMLRYLCPNCDSQLETRGGRNKGRVRVHESGFTVKTGRGTSRTSLLIGASAVLGEES
jgi:hypothetical protein